MAVQGSPLALRDRLYTGVVAAAGLRVMLPQVHLALAGLAAEVRHHQQQDQRIQVVVVVVGTGLAPLMAATGAVEYALFGIC